MSRSRSADLYRDAVSVHIKYVPAHRPVQKSPELFCGVPPDLLPACLTFRRKMYPHRLLRTVHYCSDQGCHLSSTDRRFSFVPPPFLHAHRPPGEVLLLQASMHRTVLPDRFRSQPAAAVISRFLPSETDTPSFLLT